MSLWMLRMAFWGPISSEVPVSNMAWQPCGQAMILPFMEMLQEVGDTVGLTLHSLPWSPPWKSLEQIL